VGERAVDLAWDVLRQAARIRSTRRRLEGRLEAMVVDVIQPAVADVAGRLKRLSDRLDDVERYLRAVDHHLDRLEAEAAHDLLRLPGAGPGAGVRRVARGPAARAAVGPGGGADRLDAGGAAG
jgi:hypothetical protein